MNIELPKKVSARDLKGTEEFIKLYPNTICPLFWNLDDTYEVITIKELIKIISIFNQNSIKLKTTEKRDNIISKIDSKSFERFIFSSSKYYQLLGKPVSKWLINMIISSKHQSFLKILERELTLHYNSLSYFRAISDIILKYRVGEGFLILKKFLLPNYGKDINKIVYKKLYTEGIRLDKNSFDYLIPTMNYGEKKIIKFDFGKRFFTIKTDFYKKFLLLNHKGDILNQTPKISALDNVVLASNGICEIKFIKSFIEEWIPLITSKLKKEIKNFHFRAFSHWDQLFIKNRHLNIFAKNLIWGIYDKKYKLISPFRYDGKNFIDINGDKLFIKNDKLISIIHPSELEFDQYMLWQEHFVDQELEPPFPQLFYPIYNNNLLKEIKFDNDQIEKIMNNKYWKNIEISDTYKKFYKKYSDNLTAYLSLSNGKADLKFKDGQKLIDPPNVPKKIYSEIYNSFKMF